MMTSTKPSRAIEFSGDIEAWATTLGTPVAEFRASIGALIVWLSDGEYTAMIAAIERKALRNFHRHRPSGTCRVVSVGARRAGRFENRQAGDRRVEDVSS